MSIPTTRDQFKEFCLRALGKPVIEINVDDDQIDDRVDVALKYYMDYHFDGADKTYYKYQLTSDDITNQYITMPDNIMGVVNIFSIGTSLGSGDMFNIRYQIALNDLYTMTSVSMVPYYMAMSHIQLLEQLLVGQKPIRYNRNINKLYIDMDWSLVSPGEYVIVEAYQVIDPDVYTRAWSEYWLQRYATCLIKQQWGTNIKKYDGMTLPGGIKFNGEKIYNDATAEREKMEKEMTSSFSLPLTDMIG